MSTEARIVINVTLYESSPTFDLTDTAAMADLAERTQNMLDDFLGRKGFGEAYISVEVVPATQTGAPVAEPADAD